MIRPGVYRLGEMVEITGKFFDSSLIPMDATNILITLRKPPPSNSIVGPFPISLDNGEVFFDFDPDIVGTWKVRLECLSPKRAVIESKFEVVPPKI
jgi:hypothetical protein